MGGRGAAGLAPHFTDDQLSVVYQNIFAALGQESQPKDVLSVYIQTLGALRCSALLLNKARSRSSPPYQAGGHNVCIACHLAQSHSRLHVERHDFITAKPKWCWLLHGWTSESTHLPRRLERLLQLEYVIS